MADSNVIAAKRGHGNQQRLNTQHGGLLRVMSCNDVGLHIYFSFLFFATMRPVTNLAPHVVLSCNFELARAIYLSERKHIVFAIKKRGGQT